MTEKNFISLAAAGLFAANAAHASVDLIAIGGLDGNQPDLSTLTAAPLENGVVCR